MRRAIAGIDVETVGLDAHGDHVGAQLVEHRRRHVIAGAVRAVDDDPPAMQVEFGRKGALAELHVPAGGIVDAPRLAERRRRYARQRSAHSALDRFLDVVTQLGTRRGEELDAVVVEWIVRCADHDACRQPQRTSQVGDARRGQRAAQIDVDAGGREARLQRGLEEVPRNAGVLADQHARPVTASGVLDGHQRAPRRPAKLHHQIRRDRRLADTTPNSVGTEVFALHGLFRIPGR